MGLLVLQKDHTRVQMHVWSSGWGVPEKTSALGQRRIIYRTTLLRCLLKPGPCYDS